MHTVYPTTRPSHLLIPHHATACLIEIKVLLRNVNLKASEHDGYMSFLKYVFGTYKHAVFRKVMPDSTPQYTITTAESVDKD
ncbi:hypothetical protein E2C01_031168 [Portunus trituberculatus]|uniref:Uncharacterized protein n=1 Tax=Portunus trituberculatus TaxID=210409 RepID=A0A5B7EWY0_PORTR|nr:hypothetical protein [Portunus trituberculatus]